jgi:hypothetical protein
MRDGEFRRRVFHEALESAAEGVADAGPDFERFPLLRTTDLAADPEIASINPIVTYPWCPSLFASRAAADGALIYCAQARDTGPV